MRVVVNLTTSYGLWPGRGILILTVLALSAFLSSIYYATLVLGVQDQLVKQKLMYKEISSDLNSSDGTTATNYDALTSIIRELEKNISPRSAQALITLSSLEKMLTKNIYLSKYSHDVQNGLINIRVVSKKGESANSLLSKLEHKLDQKSVILVQQKTRQTVSGKLNETEFRIVLK